MSGTRDQQARAAALDVSQSFLVQAPAGSGKTELLIRRYLALLATVEQPEEIVAITFTRKAAAEMLARIFDALNAAGDAVSPDEHRRQTQELARRARERDQQRGWELLRNPARLRVETIDALCAEIATAAPVAAQGRFGKVEEDAHPLYLEAARLTIRDLASPDPVVRGALRLLLLHVDGEVQGLQGLIAQMLEARDQWTRYLPKNGQDSALRANLDRALRNANTRALRELRNCIPPGLIIRILECANSAAQNEPAKNPGVVLWANLSALPDAKVQSLPQWIALRTLLLTGNGDWRSNVNVSIGFPSQLRDEKLAMERLLGELRREDHLKEALLALDKLPPVAVDDKQWLVAQALFRVLPVAVRHLKQVFAESGTCDFPAVAEAALRVLQAKAEAGRSVGIQHLLVDEYQDTSLTQQELLERLVAGWGKNDGRTIFLVGDPMQSIYAFRQAEVALYLQMQSARRIAHVPLTVLRLERNFRSGAGLVKWVNTAFRQIFPAEEDADTGAVTYAPMQEVQQRPTEVKMHPFIATQDQSDADLEEAQRVADLVARHQVRSPDETIAILVSARPHLRLIVPELQRRGLRFRAVDIQPLAEVQVVRDLQALTRALLHPADRIAWLALLRGPCCGLDLADLERLSGSLEEKLTCIPELLERNAHCLAFDAQERLSRFKVVMDAAQRRRGRIPLSSLVEGTWIALGGPACASTEDITNATSYFRTLSELEHAGEVGEWRRVEARIEQLYAAPDPLADGKLQIMTIHKAKGLEFDVVIVPQLGRTWQEDKASLLLWREFAGDNGPELLLAPIGAKGDEDDPLYKYLQRVQRNRRTQELKRLLYVAATRARRTLHVLGCARLNSNGKLAKPEKSSALGQLWPVVEAEFHTALHKFSLKQPGLFTKAAGRETQSLRRLPLDWKLPAAPPSIARADVLAMSEGAAEPITFEWVSDFRRHVGTVVHACLQRIALEGLRNWSDARIAEEHQQIKVALRAAGLAEPQIDEACTEVERALRTTISDPRGRWCLDAHPQAENELSLSGIVNGTLHHVRIDRTFLCDGVRWIVDYKTGAREGAGREAFFDNELRRYSEQLSTYAALLQGLYKEPIRAGLYFPVSAAWRELPLAHGATAD